MLCMSYFDARVAAYLPSSPFLSLPLPSSLLPSSEYLDRPQELFSPSFSTFILPRLPRCFPLPVLSLLPVPHPSSLTFSIRSCPLRFFFSLLPFPALLPSPSLLLFSRFSSILLPFSLLHRCHLNLFQVEQIDYDVQAWALVRESFGV
mmetsp:Transcript_39862/g.125232  ORF Transcript_39862/g.125232 Transcript_39862/m.125232 type:complete len:148 (+) Transcript_39862:622-1065(+)